MSKQKFWQQNITLVGIEPGPKPFESDALLSELLRYVEDLRSLHGHALLVLTECF